MLSREGMQLFTVLAALGSAFPNSGAAQGSAATLSPATRLEYQNARGIWADYRGRQALRLAPLEGHESDTDQEMSAVLVGSGFRDGVIEVDLAGSRRAGYATDNASAFKGFIGISFRVRGDSAERIYLRPENARLPEEEFRNRSTQYESSPDFPWHRLREETPGRYESYVDLEPGAWTRVRIEVAGTTAKLFVNDATRPSLVVTDLKHGDSIGAVALWTRISSEAWFSNLRITPR